MWIFGLVVMYKKKKVEALYSVGNPKTFNI